MIRTFLLYLALAVTCPRYAFSHSLHGGWGPESSPEIMSSYFTNNFHNLPLEGRIISSTMYWSGDYWALNKGSINFRWNAKVKKGHDLVSPDKKLVSSLKIPELAELSPAEKYDLYLGRYDYPLKKEVARRANPNADHWEGMCHGWAPAAMNHREPFPKTLRNPDGIEIPFGSTDIKALLSYYYAYHHEAPGTHQIGRRCFSRPTRDHIKDCGDDLNAGAFHLVLANRLGLEGKGFIADLHRYNEVWNNPITSYRSIILKEVLPDETSAPGTIRKIRLRTEISYIVGNGHDWHPVIGSNKQAHKKLIYTYDVELDSQDEIIGGEWISNERPDFLWLMYKSRNFAGIFSKLGDLLND